MVIVKSITLFVLLLAFTVTQANAATTNYSLVQSKALPDEVSHVLATTSTTTAGDIVLSAELITLIPTASGPNFIPSLTTGAHESDATVPTIKVPESIALLFIAIFGLVASVISKKSI